MPPLEREEETKLHTEVVLDKADPGTDKRPAFDLRNFVAIAGLVVSVAAFLWLSIANIDDDVGQLAATVQTLVGDVGYIKGRLESIPSVSRAPGDTNSPVLVSHLTGDDATFP